MANQTQMSDDENDLLDMELLVSLKMDKLCIDDRHVFPLKTRKRGPRRRSTVDSSGDEYYSADETFRRVKHKSGDQRVIADEDYLDFISSEKPRKRKSRNRRKRRFLSGDCNDTQLHHDSDGRSEMAVLIPVPTLFSAAFQVARRNNLIEQLPPMISTSAAGLGVCGSLNRKAVMDWALNILKSVETCDCDKIERKDKTDFTYEDFTRSKTVRMKPLYNVLLSGPSTKKRGKRRQSMHIPYSRTIFNKCTRHNSSFDWTDHTYSITYAKRQLDSDVLPSWRPYCWDLCRKDEYERCFAKMERVPFAAYVTYLDGMVPVLERTSTKSCQTTLLYSAMSYLRRLFPDFVEHMHDEASAYIWWARGLADRATDAFLKVIRTSQSGKKKAMYYNELARMCSWFGDLDSAIVNFENAVVEYTRGLKGMASDDLLLGQQILKAKILDTGVFSANKRFDMQERWNDVFCLPEREEKNSIILAAYDSYVMHTGNSSDDSVEQLDNLLSFVIQHTENHPQMHLNFAFLSAMAGRIEDSNEHFQKFLHKYFYYVENDEQFDRRGKYLFTQDRHGCWKNDFSFLADVVNKQKFVPRLMPVVWRSQLLHSYVGEGRVLDVADICSATLNFRLNDLGYLTADMQTSFPPMSEICMDPFTGRIVFTKALKRISPWLDLPHTTLFSPVPVTLLETDTCRVDIFISNHWGGECSSANVVRTDAKGTTEVLDLFSLVQDERKETALKLMAQQEKEDDRIRLITDHIEWSHSKKRFISYWHACKASDKKNKNAASNSAKRPAILRLVTYRALNNSVLLLFYAGDEDGCYYYSSYMGMSRDHSCGPSPTTLVVINCETTKTFKQPLIRVSPNDPFSFDHKSYNMNYDGWTARNCILPYELSKRHQTNSEVFMVAGNSGLYKFSTEAYEQERAALHFGSEFLFDSKCVVGEKFYGVVNMAEQGSDSKHQTSIYHAWVRRTADAGDTTDGFPQLRHVFSIGKCLVVHTVQGIRFAQPVSFAPVIITDCDQQKFHLPAIHDDGEILGDFLNCALLCKYHYKKTGFSVVRAVIMADQTIIIVDINEDTSMNALSVSLISNFSFFGKTLEAYVVSASDGLLLTTTNEVIDEDRGTVYLFHTSFSGEIYGFLPLRTANSLSLSILWLTPEEEHSKLHPDLCKPGFFAVFRDGGMGIVCIRVSL